MVNNIIEYSIRNRIMVVFIFVVIGLGAVFSLKTARIDAIPDIGENQQIIFTKWSGRAPTEIEAQITYPLSTSLQGISGVKSVRATSAFGFSIIYLIFNDDTEFYWSRSRVLEKLANLGNILPKGVTPQLGPDATGLGQVYWYTIENIKGASQPKSLAELRTIQDFYVKYLLQGVQGVSEVASIGGFINEFQINIDPRKLFAFDTHFTKLIAAIKNSNIDVGAEVIEQGGRETIIRGKGFFKSLKDIKQVVVGVKDGIAIRLGDIAEVTRGPGFRRGALDKNGIESVGGVVTMRYGENPKVVIDNLKQRLKAVRKGLPEGVVLTPFYDRTVLIEKTIGTVYTALTQEIVITIIVILLFLLHFRSSLLVTMTLPFGVGISFILMKILHIDSNIMSLSGLVIAIGSMVDMGIIMTENIYSALAQNPVENLKERIKVITKAAKEVGPAIITATMTTIITFLPVFALQSSEGKLFGPLAWAKTLAMFGSVIVAVILIPVLSVFFLKGKLRSRERNPISTSIYKIYRPALKWVLYHRKLFLLVPIFVLLLGGFSYSKLTTEFMPELNEGEILYMPVSTPEISMTKARELLSYTDEIIVQHPLVSSAVGKLGRAESALDPAPIAMFETIIKLVDNDLWPAGKSINDIMQELDASLQVPGLVNAWTFPIQNRINMISTGIKTQVGIKIFGSDLKRLEQLAQQVGRQVEQVAGAYGVYAEVLAGKSYLEFDIDRVAASRYGINTGVINKILQTAVGGMIIGEFYDGRKRFPIRVRYKKEFRDNVNALKQVLVPSPLGYHIPISQLAKVRIVKGPAAINSENGMLRSLVLLNIRGRDIMSFVKAAKKKVEQQITLPQGYSILWEGQYKNEVRANNRLLMLIPIALAVNLLIIFLGIKNMVNSVIVFSAVPVAMAGGLILLWVGGFNISVAVWVGFIALFGIAVDDGVVFMTYLQKAVHNSQPQNFTELVITIIDAGSRRIRPLVMTTTTTVIALLPIMWSTSTGSEIMKPMAIPILGGMAVELITLFIIPVIFSYVQMNKISQTRRQ